MKVYCWSCGGVVPDGMPRADGFSQHSGPEMCIISLSGRLDRAQAAMRWFRSRRPGMEKPPDVIQAEDELQMGPRILGEGVLR